MKRIRRAVVNGSVFLVGVCIALLQGPGGLGSLAWASCPEPSFARQVAIPGGGVVEGIALGDFNGDGEPDLALTNFTAGGPTANNVAILLGDGRGSFGTPKRFAVGRGATRIVASDFNADDRTDVAVLNSRDGTVSVLLGDGQGGLAPQATLLTGGTPTGLALGDLNEDGNGDLIVTDFFSARVTIFLGLGDGLFSAPTALTSGPRPLLVDVGDLDSDGRLDLAIDNGGDPSLSIHLGNGDGTFAPEIVVPVPGGLVLQSLALSDLDGDGVLDIAVVNASDNTVLVLSGQGDGSFGLPQAFAVGKRPVFIAVGDLNDDGIPDLAVPNVDDMTLSVLLGRGDGTFGPQTTLPVGNAPVPVAIGDVNRDGAPDLITGNVTDQTVSVLLNECTENRPPASNAGPDQILECTGDRQATARLDGSGSTDPDSTPGTNDDIDGFEWSERGVILLTGETGSVPLHVGAHVLSLEVIDKSGATDTDIANIKVSDTIPPVITSIEASPTTVRHNQKHFPVSVTIVATDSCDVAPTCRIDSVTRNDPTPARGDVIEDPGLKVDAGPKPSPATFDVFLRAGHSGTERVFTIDVSCSDIDGNVSSGVTTVTVSHDNGRRSRGSQSATPVISP